MWAWLGASVVGCLLSLPTDLKAATVVFSVCSLVAPVHGVFASYVYFFNRTAKPSSDDAAYRIKMHVSIPAMCQSQMQP